MLFKSITNRLVFSYFTASLIVLCVFSGVTLYSIKHHFYEQDYFHIDQKFRTIDKLRMDGNFIEKFGEFFEAGDTKLWLIEDEKLIYRSQNVSLPDGFTVRDSDMKFEWSNGQDSFRAKMYHLENSPGVHAVIGVTINHHKVFIHGFSNVLIFTTLLASVISGLLGWLIARKELAPIKRLERHVSNITTHQLDIRVPAHGFPKELMPLVVGFNEMLNRLEGDFERLSEFSSDIAHELRTPVGNMMTQTQVALSQPRSSDEYQNILISNIEELNRITKTITDMLYLAKSEHNLLLKTNEAFELADLAEELADYYEMAGDEKEITIALSGTSRVTADKNMIKRAIGNLLSNAVRHSDDHSNIDVTINQSASHSHIAVSNFGEVIPEASLPYIFDRFYRVDKSRAHTSSAGAGLGLSITRSIARLHNGDIDLVSEEGKTTFTLTIETIGSNP
ncbi:heavy metal sensor histidine kinase [Vibrio profundi]|uniref:heavy metal sensor histidine kinase n=1 Tax=Vibrio profundi TaxID=1774960 RepID=UPI00373669A6